MSLLFDARLASRGFDVRLTVEPGETLAVLGPNGAGKSTLLGLIAGMLRPDSGRVELDGRVLFAHGAGATNWLPAHQRGVALLAQEPLLFPHLSAHANVAFGPRSAGASRAAAAAIADKWLAETDTRQFAARRPHELSGGQAQRVAIARALAAEPRLLLLDEPLSALDVTATVTLRRMLRHVTAPLTTIIVTHDALDAFLLADRVIVLNDGAVVEEGRARDVLERPKHAFTAELVGLTLLSGRRTARGLVTAAGVEIIAAGTPSTQGASGTHEASGGPEAPGLSGAVETAGAATVSVALGAPVAAALRPTVVRVSRLLDSGAADTAPDTNTVIGTVHDLEPRGDLIRVRTEWLSADLQPSRVADLDLAPGVRVALTFSPADVALYPL